MSTTQPTTQARIFEVLKSQLNDYNVAWQIHEPTAYKIIRLDPSKPYLEAFPKDYATYEDAEADLKGVEETPGIYYRCSYLFGEDKKGLNSPPLYLLNPPHQDGTDI